MSIKIDKEKTKRVMITGISVICIAVLLQAVYLPKSKQVKLLLEKEDKLKKDIAGFYNFIGGKDNLEKKITNLREQAVIMEDVFPFEKEAAEVIKGLNLKAKDFKVNVVSLTPHDTAVYKDQDGHELKIEDYLCKCMPMSLTVEAKYHMLGKFLASLEESNSPIMSIEQVKIDKDKAVHPDLKAKIDLVTYILGKE